MTTHNASPYVEHLHAVLTAAPVATASLALPSRLDSVVAAVLADLLDGRRLTHDDCRRRHGSSRLSHHIYVLRGLGWSARTNTRHVPTADGRIAAIGVYYLPGDTIAQVGERERRYINAVWAARAARRAA